MSNSTIDDIIDNIKFALYDMAFCDIKESHGKGYKAFVKNYLPSCYVPHKLYTDLCCKLVHNYSARLCTFLMDCFQSVLDYVVCMQIIFACHPFHATCKYS